MYENKILKFNSTFNQVNRKERKTVNVDKIKELNDKATDLAEKSCY